MVISRSRGSEATAWRSALPEWPLGSKPKSSSSCFEPRAQHRHFLGRNAQRLAGPQAGVDADAGDLAAFAERNDDQVERHPAVDGRLALGLGHQRHVAALLEIAHRAEAAALVGRRAGDAEDAERVRRRLVAAARPDSRAGSSRRRRTSRAGPRLRDRRSPRRPRASCACSVRPVAHRERGRRRARAAGRRRAPAGRARRRGRARGTSSIRGGSCRRTAARPRCSSPSSSRSTQTTGWSRRWMVSWRAAIALATESTRNGMSSLTMPMRIRRLPASPPVDSIASASSPRLRLRGDLGEEFGGFALGLAAEALGFAGQAHFRSAPCESTRPAAGPGACGPS